MVNLWLLPGRAILVLGGGSGSNPGAGSPDGAGGGCGGSGGLGRGFRCFSALLLILDHHQVLRHLLKLVDQPLPFHFGQDSSLVVISGRTKKGIADIRRVEGGGPVSPSAPHASL